MTPEGALKADCRKWLRSRGAYVFSPVQTGYGVSTLDDLVCWEGKFIAVEYKVKPNKPTERQLVIANIIEDAGGEVFFCYSFGELQDYFRGIT